jgi:hypothetical protein
VGRQQGGGIGRTYPRRPRPLPNRQRAERNASSSSSNDRGRPRHLLDHEPIAAMLIKTTASNRRPRPPRSPRRPQRSPTSSSSSSSSSSSLSSSPASTPRSTSTPSKLGPTNTPTTPWPQVKSRSAFDSPSSTQSMVANRCRWDASPGIPRLPRDGRRLPHATARWDAAAPMRSNITPAYAHSFNRANPGTSSAGTASNVKTPRIVTTSTDADDAAPVTLSESLLVAGAAAWVRWAAAAGVVDVETQREAGATSSAQNSEVTPAPGRSSPARSLTGCPLTALCSTSPFGGFFRRWSAGTWT